MAHVIKVLVRGLFRRFGFDVVRYDEKHFLERRRARVLSDLKVDLVADVGANSGQFGREIRAGGYRGSIVSFEPLPDAFAELVRRADRSWTCHGVALGDEDGEAVLNRSENSWSSSLLQINDVHVGVAPEARYVGTEAVAVRTLDSFRLAGRIYLKVDAQGYEDRVLAGASETLESVVAVELELSLAPLYEGQVLWDMLLQRMTSDGFRVVGLSPELVDSSGAILQVNAIFAR
jgi:FkbM family methyltransferase